MPSPQAATPNLPSSKTYAQRFSEAKGRSDCWKPKGHLESKSLAVAKHIAIATAQTQMGTSPIDFPIRGSKDHPRHFYYLRKHVTMAIRKRSRYSYQHASASMRATRKAADRAEHRDMMALVGDAMGHRPLIAYTP